MRLGNQTTESPSNPVRFTASTRILARLSIASELATTSDGVGSTTPSRCSGRQVYQHSALLVRTPAPEIILVMKLYRAEPQDREDLITLWPLCAFTDPDKAAHAFRLAYPHAPEDEHLASYIADVARDATQQYE